MSLRTCVIVNPASGGGATGRDWELWRAALDGVLEGWAPRFTRSPGEATRLARDAVKDGCEQFVVLGGDGTMNEVVCGLFDERGDGSLVRPGLVLAPVRTGTGGDFARGLGLPFRLPEAVAHLAGSCAAPCDLGFTTFVSHTGEPAWRGFLNIASFGLSGLVARNVNAGSKRLGGRISFFLGLCRSLLSYRRQEVRVRVDGAVHHEGPLTSCAVANGTCFGGGMRIAPQARTDDGRFDVVTQTRSGCGEILSIGDLYNGKILGWPSVLHIRGSAVEASPLNATTRVLLDIDGESPGCLPARFTILPGAVRIKTAPAPLPAPR